MSQRKFKYNLALAVLLIIGSITVATSWATVTYIKSPTEETMSAPSVQSGELVSTDKTTKSGARAPEPGTLALFGTGVFGMIMSFVRKTYAAAKRVLDIIFSIAGLIVLTPVLLIISLAVKLTSKGPVFYSQTRVGKNGEIFEMYKFRTMCVDAEKNTGAVWAKANDPRLTAVGGILRKTHFDELPQLWNVLRGEMSIIGPRPERPMFVDQFKQKIRGYENRLAVKPGITGLAQVRHRYDESIEDVKIKLKYDLKYIAKMCLFTDFQIVLRTFRVVLTGEGAR